MGAPCAGALGWYGSWARATPARNAPSSGERWSPSAADTTRKHHARLPTRSAAWERAIDPRRKGRSFQAAMATAAKRSVIPANAVAMFAARPSGLGNSSPPIPATNVRTSTTARSCTSSTPTATRPCLESSSRSWSRTFTTTTVEEKVSAMPRKTASRPSSPNAAAVAPTASPVPSICRAPAPRATRPTSRIFPRDSSRPTRKSRRMIPASEMSSVVGVTCTTPNAGPSPRPATMYATIVGTRSARARRATAVPARRMAPRFWRRG